MQISLCAVEPRQAVEESVLEMVIGFAEPAAMRIGGETEFHESRENKGSVLLSPPGSVSPRVRQPFAWK